MPARSTLVHSSRKLPCCSRTLCRQRPFGGIPAIAHPLSNRREQSPPIAESQGWTTAACRGWTWTMPGQ